MADPTLLVRLHSLGDIVLASGAAAALAQRGPVLFAVNPAYVPVVDRIPGQVTPVPVTETGELRRAAGGCARVIDLQNSIKTRFALMCIPAKKYSFSRRKRRRILRGSGERMEWRPREFMKVAGVEEGNPAPVLRRKGEPAAAPMRVGIVTGGRWPMKSIPPGVAAELARLYCDCSGASVFLLGSSGDRKEALAVRNACGYRNVETVAGEGDITALIERIEGLHLLVSPDSGPAHLGMALGVPTMVVFTSTSPALGFFSRENRGCFMAPDIPCRPCHRHGGTRCRTGDGNCRKMLVPGEIYRESLCLMQ